MLKGEIQQSVTASFKPHPRHRISISPQLITNVILQDFHFQRKSRLVGLVAFKTYCHQAKFSHQAQIKTVAHPVITRTLDVDDYRARSNRL